METEMTKRKSSSDEDSDNEANVDVPGRSSKKVKKKKKKEPISDDDEDEDDDDNDSENEANSNKKKNITKKKRKEEKKNSDDDTDSGDSDSDDDSDDDDDGSTADARKRRKEREKKKKERMEIGQRRKRSSSAGPFSPDAEYRLYKLFSFTMAVFIFITAVVCFQWNCLYAHMCFVTEDPAVPQPQSDYIVPVLAFTFILGLLNHLIIMSESPSSLVVLGFATLTWSIVVMVFGSICFGNADPAVSLTISEAAWKASPFSDEVISNYYKNVAALQTKMQFNLNSLGGCAIAISILQLMHSTCSLIFGINLLRS
jgi:hypothetical protein